MRGKVLRKTQPRAHECPTPWRFFWRGLGLGAQWQCDCGVVWEVQRKFVGIARAGNEICETRWVILKARRSRDIPVREPGGRPDWLKTTK